MLKVVKDMAFQMLLLYLLTMGIYGHASMSVHYPVVHDKNTESRFVAPSLNPSLYVGNLQQKDADLKNVRPISIKLVQKAFSVHSADADEIVVNKVSNYIGRYSLILITPRISDILYPFHYHL
jgi:hypothetical protein